MIRPAALLLIWLGVGFSCRTTTEPGKTEAVIRFAFDGYPADTLRVLVRHTSTIEEARRVIAGESSAHIPIGPIVRGSGVDARYPFHFLPDSVRLTEAAIELCDGAPMHTPEEVDEFIFGATGDPNATRAHWCPWGARPVEFE